MNILIIHEVNWVHKVVYEIHFLSELLSMRGHNVYAIDYSVNNEGFWSRHAEVGVARAYSESKVTLIRPAFLNLPLLSRASASVSHYFVIKEAIKKYKIQVIILYSVPTNGLQTLNLAKQFGIPVVFRSIDVLNQLVPPVLSGLTEQLEGMVYRRADLVLALNGNMYEYVKRKGARNIQILPLGVDEHFFKPSDVEVCLKARWGINPEDKVVAFVGTLYDFCGVDRVVEKWGLVLKEIPNAKLLVVGDGKMGQWLRDKAIVTGFQPYSDMPSYINLADVCINPTVSCKATDAIFPTKVIQYMACGKPVVATELNGLYDMVGVGNGILYGDVTSNLIKLLKDEKLSKFLGEKALTYVKKCHSYDKIIPKLENILQEVVNEHRSH